MDLFLTPEEPDDLDPLVAGIFGNLRALWEKYTSSERRANVKKQLRDRYGKWIDMGKSSKFNLRDSNGGIQSYIGVYVGPSDIEDHGRFLVIDSKTGERKIYHIASGNLQQVEGVIDAEYLQKLGLLDADGKPDESKLGDDFQDISSIKIEDPTDEDEESAKLEIPDLPDMAKIVKGQKPNPTKRRNILPGAIVQGADSNAYALVSDVETKNGETTLFLRFQNGERRVSRGSANGSVFAWMPKEGETEQKEAPSVPDLDKLDIATDRIRIGDRVFDNVSESYATIEAISKSEDGQSLDITIKFADGREQTITRPIDQPITVWREPNLGTAGKSSEQIAEIKEAEPEAPKKEPKEKAVKVPRSAMPRGLSNMGKIMWELERKGKPLSTWNILWTFPFGVPQDAPLERKKIAEQSQSVDERFPVTISEVTGEALENIKKLNNMGGKIKDMLPKTEEEFNSAVERLLGPGASKAQIEAAKDIIRKKAEDDTREFKIVRVGHNFFVRFREGDDMPPEKLAGYLEQVANLASKTTLGETPVFITLLNDGEVGAGGRLLYNENHKGSKLHGFTFYNPKRNSDGVQISINTSLENTGRHARTIYHEFGHGVHHILTGYNMDKNAPNALRFRSEFAKEIADGIAKSGISPDVVEKELFADLYADLMQALFEGRADLVNPKFLEFYNSIVTGDIYDGTYNALTRQLFGEPVEVSGPESGDVLTAPGQIQSEADKKGYVRTADDPYQVKIGSYVWTSAVTGTLEKFQIGDILPAEYVVSSKATPSERAALKRSLDRNRKIVLLIKDESGSVVGKAVVRPTSVYYDKDNAPIQQKNGLTSAEDIIEAFKQQHPNFADKGDPKVRKLFSFNTPQGTPGLATPRPRHTTEYAGGSFFIADRQAGQSSPRTNEAGEVLYQSMVWDENGQSVNGYGNNVFESTDPEEALRKAAELLASHNSKSENAIAEIMAASSEQEDLTPEETSKYNNTPTPPSSVVVTPITPAPATPATEDTTPKSRITTADGSTFDFFNDGRITGIGHQNRTLFYPVVDASGSVTVRSIEIRSEKTSPFAHIKTDSEGNLTHVRVDQNTGEIHEVDLGNISKMFTSKDAARAAGSNEAKQISSNPAATPEPEGQEKTPSADSDSPTPIKMAQATAIGSKAKELLKLIEPNNSFKVEDGTRETRSVFNFSGLGQSNSGGFGGFTFQPDPSKNMLVAVITSSDGKEISRHVVPGMPGRPVETVQRAADFQLARGIAAANYVVENPEADIDNMYSDDSSRDSVSPEYENVSSDVVSTDHRARVFAPESMEESEDIDEMISKPWKARVKKEDLSMPSHKILDESNPIETLHPGALVLDNLTGQIGRVRGVAVEIDEATGRLKSSGGWQVEFFNGPVSAMSGVNPVNTNFNEFGQKTQVAGKIHSTSTGSDFDDRRFYTIEVRDPEDFTNVTKSFIADTPEGAVLVHDSTVGIVDGVDGIARVAGFSGEGMVIVSIENSDGTSELREISVADFKPLSIGINKMAPHGSVIGNRFMAEASINPAETTTLDAIRVLGTLNNMAFIDEDVAKAMLRSITNGYLTSSGLKQVLDNLDSHESIRKIKAQSGRGQLNQGVGLALGNASKQVLDAAENAAKNENGEEPPITISQVVESDGVRKPSNRQLKSIERRLAIDGILPEERLKEIWNMLPDLDAKAIGPVIQELDNAELIHRMDQGLPVNDIFDRRISAIFGNDAIRMSPEVAERLKTFVPTRNLDGTPLDGPVDPMETAPDIDEMSEEQISQQTLDGIRLSSEQSEVFALVENTNDPIFITGKAGTGKSTLLKFLRKFSRKGSNMSVVAPSGMAALNVDGLTIPRVFPGDFNIPYWAQNAHVLLYGDGAANKGLSKKRLDVLQNMEVLVVDEISMVNADTVDHIDRILRAAKHQPGIPFGGVQLIMFGDPYQLPPVVKENSNPNSHAATFKENYQSPWFFHADVWGYQGMNRVQLNQVFRQKDPEFIEILNAVRNGTASWDQLQRLNEMGYQEDPSEIDQDVVRIYAKRFQVLQRNNEMLDKLPGQEVSFRAIQSGNKIYKEDDDSSPAPVNLRVKVGARVLFLDNDKDKRFVNGSGGTITAIGKDTIMVLVDGQSKPIAVERKVTAGTEPIVRQENNGTSVKNVIKSVGNGNIFEQFPFQIGYAITIHKSQGQSYDQAVIDVDGVFAAGQGYVALSRVRSPEGLHLTSKVLPKHMITDPNVKDFMYELEFNEDGTPIETVTVEAPAQLGEQSTADKNAPARLLFPGVRSQEAREKGLVETPKFLDDFEVGDYISGYDDDAGTFGWLRIVKISDPFVVHSESGDRGIKVELSDGMTREIREYNGRSQTDRLTKDAIESLDKKKESDDIDLMESGPEPFDPNDVTVDPIKASGIEDITKNIDGNPISESKMTYINNVVRIVSQMESYLDGLENSPKLFEGDEQSQENEKKLLREEIQERKKRIVNYWSALEENIRASKPSNTADVVRSRTKLDEKRSELSLPIKYVPSREQGNEPESSRGKYPTSYSTYTYADQYGREYLIGSITYVPEDTQERRPSGVDMDEPKSYTFAVDKASPEFKSVSQYWNATINAAQRGVYRNQLGTRGKDLASWLSVDEDTIAMVNTDPLYQRRGLATALLEVARDTIGEGHTVNHSSSITNVAQAWSDVVDSDRPELRSYVPEHDFKKAPESDIDEMAGNWLLDAFKEDLAKQGLDPEEELRKMGVTRNENPETLLDDLLTPGNTIRLGVLEELIDRARSIERMDPDELLPKEYEAIREYVMNAYKAINSILRGELFSSDDFEEEKLKQFISLIDGLFDKAKKTEEPTVTFRGFNFGIGQTRAIETFKNIQVGDIIEDAGFTSTSEDPLVSWIFGPGREAPNSDVANQTPEDSVGGVFMIVNIPVGSRILPVPVNVAQVNAQELEVILPSGSKFRVKDVKRVPVVTPRGEPTDYVNHFMEVDLITDDDQDSSIDNMEEWEPKEVLTSGKGESDFLDSVVDGDYLNLNAAPDRPVLSNFEKEDLYDEQHKALSSYTGAWYKFVNNHLRGTGRNNENVESEAKDMVPQIDSIIDIFGDVSSDSVVFRGMSDTYDKQNGKRIHEYLDTAKIGDVFSDNGYMSATNDSSVALSFGPGGPESAHDAANHSGSQNNSSFWIISIPAGGKALALPRVGYGYGSEEREVILPRGSQLRLDAIRRVPHLDEDGEELGTYNYYVEATSLPKSGSTSDDVDNMESSEPAPEKPEIQPLMDMVNESEIEARRKVREIFSNVNLGNGFYLDPPSTDMFITQSNRLAMKIEGSILNQNTKVGIYELEFIDTPEGLVVFHKLLGIYDESARGKGFGTEYGKWSKDVYKQLGVSAIKIDAGLEMGAYTWAKAGFDWSGKPSIVIGRISQLINQTRSGSDANDAIKELNTVQKQKLRLVLKSLLARMDNKSPDDPNYPKPFEIANLDPIGNFNVSKQILNENSFWSGIKKLDSDIDEMSEDLNSLSGKPLVRALLKSSDSEIKDFLSSKFAQGDFGDFEVKISAAFKLGEIGAITFSGDIYAPDRDGRKTIVGFFSRGIDIDSDGEYSMYHEGLTIQDEEYRGRGFGTKFSKFSEDLYRKMGISKIHLTASDEDGSYVWGKAGYEWADKPIQVIFRVKRLIEQVGASDESLFEPGAKTKILDMLADYRDRFNDLRLSDRGYPTPIEIANAMVGNYNLGRNILGDNVRWRGVKYL